MFRAIRRTHGTSPRDPSSPPRAAAATSPRSLHVVSRHEMTHCPVLCASQPCPSSRPHGAHPVALPLRSHAHTIASDHCMSAKQALRLFPFTQASHHFAYLHDTPAERRSARRLPETPSPVPCFPFWFCDLVTCEVRTCVKTILNTPSRTRSVYVQRVCLCDLLRYRLRGHSVYHTFLHTVSVDCVDWRERVGILRGNFWPLHLEGNYRVRRGFSRSYVSDYTRDLSVFEHS